MLGYRHNRQGDCLVVVRSLQGRVPSQLGNAHPRIALGQQGILNRSRTGLYSNCVNLQFRKTLRRFGTVLVQCMSREGRSVEIPRRCPDLGLTGVCYPQVRYMLHRVGMGCRVHMAVHKSVHPYSDW